MSVRYKISRQGLELIKGFEGLRQKAVRRPDGRWTIGYGHTLTAREGRTLSAEDAESLLLYDLLPVVDAVNAAVKTPLNQNQFDALVSFAFNIGLDLFHGSNVLERINQGRLDEAVAALEGWRTAEFNGRTYVLEPLIRRREAEKALFLTPVSALRPVVPEPETPKAGIDSAITRLHAAYGAPASQAWAAAPLAVVRAPVTETEPETEPEPVKADTPAAAVPELAAFPFAPAEQEATAPVAEREAAAPVTEREAAAAEPDNAEAAPPVVAEAVKEDAPQHSPAVKSPTLSDRIALTLKEVREVSENRKGRLLSTLKPVILSVVGMVCIGGGVATYTGARHAESMGQALSDYSKLSGILAAFGVVLVFVAIWLLLRRLAGLKA